MCGSDILTLTKGTERVHCALSFHKVRGCVGNEFKLIHNDETCSFPFNYTNPQLCNAERFLLTEHSKTKITFGKTQ